MEDTDTESPSGTGQIGFVTAIETEDGDQLSVNDITPDHRKEWCATLKNRIERIDGISNAYGGGFTHQHHQSARLEIVPTHSIPEYGRGVEITENLRSLSPRLRNTIADYRYVSNYTVVETPTSLGNGRYDEALYIIEVNFY